MQIKKEHQLFPQLGDKTVSSLQATSAYWKYRHNSIS